MTATISSRWRWNRSPLAYPAGAIPSVDQNHPASRNLRLSAVPVGAADYINLVTGARLTNQSVQVGLAVPGIDGSVGPNLTSSTADQSLGIAVPSVARTQHTFAAIFKFSSDLAGLYQGVVVVQNQYGFYIRVKVPILFTNADNTPSITLTLGHSYFVAISTSLGNPSPIFYVAKDLGTGQIFSSTVTQTAASGTGSSINVGNDTGNSYSDFPVATAMCSETVLSMPELLAWAADPWSFWYPNAFQELSGTPPVTLLVSTVQSWPSLRRKVVVIGT